MDAAEFEISEVDAVEVAVEDAVEFGISEDLEVSEEDAVEVEFEIPENLFLQMIRKMVVEDLVERIQAPVHFVLPL